MLASQFIGKYAGFIVLDHFEPAVIYSLLTLRQNIYTDPQKPIQVSPGLYEIGEPDADSPLLVTTNFSLTYFSVAGEVEGSGTARLAAGGRLRGPVGADRLGRRQVRRRSHRQGREDDRGRRTRSAIARIVIPGAVAGLSGELEEELPGWQVLVGPRESIGIPSYLKHLASQG